MGTPAVFPSSFGFGTNYLLNPKPGEKRHFLSTLRKSYQASDSVPYIVNVLPDFVDKPIEQTFTPTYLCKYGTKMPFHVPQLKMPSLVGGFVGAKSQSLREDCKKLGDIMASALSQILCNSNDASDCPNTEVMNNKNMEKTGLASNLHSRKESVVSHERVYTFPSGMAKESDISAPLRAANVEPDVSGKERPKNEEDRDKPPLKKPKLNLQSCRSSPKRRHKAKRKRCEKNVHCISPVVLPGYDPVHSSFECVDEVDCGIELFNRFAPLEDSSNFHMWSDCDPESSDSPLLDMLNEMHIDDFEVNFDGVSSDTRPYNIRSYEVESPLTCNPAIAFILSGNDDILASDSEDGSLVSDLEEWQSFKADFEYFTENLPMSGIVVGQISNLDVDLDGDLDVLDDEIFLNNLEYQSVSNGMEQRLREVNRKWNQSLANEHEERNPPKVCFAPDDCLTSVVYIPSGPEESQARKSPWDQIYMDRCRFEKKIKELEPIISSCLTPQHRKSVFQRLYGSDHTTQ